MESVKTWLSSKTAHTSLTQAYKNVFPYITSASIQAMTMLRSSLSMYLFFLHNKISLLTACFLTAHRRLLSE
jgi:hypothetical protein